MSRTAVRFVYVALGAAAFACAFNIYVTLRTVGEEARAAQVAFRENIVWFATQLAYEVDAFVHAFDDYQTGRKGVERTDMVDRFDVVWSRFADFEQTQAGQRMMRLAAAPAVIATARTMLDEMDSAVAAFEPHDGAGARLIRQQMRFLYHQLHDLALDALHQHNAERSAEAARGRAMRTRIMLLIASILTSCALLVALILMERAKVAALKDGLAETVAARTSELTREVAERREAERELERYRDRLEEEVRVRTSDLRDAQQDLLLSERLAAIGKLTGTVSHELRTPLGTIHNSFAVLRRQLGPADEPVAGNLARIDRNLARCNRIIEDLLAYARAPTHDRRPLELAPWLDETLADLDLPPGLEMTGDTGAGGIVEADPGRLRQALVNLVHNAFNAVAEREGDTPGKVEVALARASGRVEIRVRDNGPGIPPELHEQIFEPLFSTRTFGVGLGLPLVRQIMEQHAGGVAVASRDDGESGAIVSLYLPELPATLA